MSTGFLIFPVGYTPIIGGVTVPGGKIHFTRTGTSTAQNTYSNSTLGSANANPVILNAAGSLETKVYGDPTTGFNYRIRIVDANDVEVMAAVDDVTADVDDTRLSANVPLLNASQTFTGLNKFTAVANEAARFIGDSAFVSFYNTADTTRTAYISGATAAFEINVNLNAPFIVSTNNTERLRIDGSGVLTTPNTSASEVGFRGSPINEQNGNYTLVLTDAGKTIYKSTGAAGETITIPANASVAFPVGTEVQIANGGGGTLSVAITSDSLLHTAGTGTRTLADSAVAKIIKVASTIWMMNGSGIT